MRFTKTIFVSLFLLLGTTHTAFATAQIHIDLSSQRMHVKSSSGEYTWKVSTARAGYTTPRGSYSPVAMKKMHYSTLYHNSPMPHSIFFRGNFAIHGTNETSRLGRPASHGCVRLAPGHAEKLFRIVQAEGGRISITGSPPSSRKVNRGKRLDKAMAAR
ncbi:MAG: L,D-transpeptidase [Gammaproteobacteria bacterium]|nr:L,D-transpeptidase [Gammaproteobacteria bacterium]MBU1656215.1 L,D-transpeptidase [Gammaproteobacteria bacterium]MBU1959780.1 L,D-transpeptidase [Gammaproteobacteria bacterium]